MTEKEKKEIIVDILTTDYDRLLHISKLICKESTSEVEDLLHTSLESILNMKRFPDFIFEDNNKKMFNYLYGIIARTYTTKSCNFKEKMGIKRDESILYECEIEDNQVVSKLDENLCEYIINYVETSVKNKRMHWYKAKLFLMFYFPEKYIKFKYYNLSEEEMDLIINRMSYRRLAELIGINYQSIRLHVLYVLEKVKKHLIKNNII